MVNWLMILNTPNTPGKYTNYTPASQGMICIKKLLRLQKQG
jgi:hypothetical protein